MKRCINKTHFTKHLYSPAVLFLLLFGAQIFAINSYSKENFEYNELLKKKEEIVKINNKLNEEVFKMGSLSYIEQKAFELGFTKAQMLFVKNPSLAAL